MVGEKMRTVRLRSGSFTESNGQEDIGEKGTKEDENPPRVARRCVWQHTQTRA
jgi:hypothetical protein